jgi:hypothetical protein
MINMERWFLVEDVGGNNAKYFLKTVQFFSKKG